LTSWKDSTLGHPEGKQAWTVLKRQFIYTG
jgi:hypothetical protein